MYNYELPDTVLKAWIRLHQASEAVEKVLERGLGRQKTTTSQVSYLSLVDANATPLTPGQLAKYAFREQHSASAQLDRMCRVGLVEKTRLKGDRRLVWIILTSKGKECLEASKQTGVSQARELLASALSEQDVAQLDSLTKKIRDKALETLGQKAEDLPDSFDVARFQDGLSNPVLDEMWIKA